MLFMSLLVTQNILSFIFSSIQPNLKCQIDMNIHEKEAGIGD